MAKRIAYIVTRPGVGSEDPEVILYAAWSERERDKMLEMDGCHKWRTCKEIVVDEDQAWFKALFGLDGIDRLILGLPAWPNNVKPKLNEYKKRSRK